MIEPRKYHVSALKSLMFEVMQGIRDDEIQALCQVWCDAGDLNTVPTGHGNVMSLDQIVQYFKDNLLLHFNSFEDSDFNEWEFFKSPVNSLNIHFDQHTDHIFGVYSGHLHTDELLGVPLLAYIRIALPSHPQYLRAEFWMKLNTSPFAAPNDQFNFFVGTGNGWTHSGNHLGINFSDRNYGGNDQWHRWRYICTPNGRKLDRLENNVWVNKDSGIAVDFSGDNYLSFELNEAPHGVENTGYDIFLDVVQIFGS